jgi:hypothetical protein
VKKWQLKKFTFVFFCSAEPELAEQEKLKSEKEAKTAKVYFWFFLFG